MAALVGRRVKLARSGRQMKGCCPFHAEKTPSFYVYEDGYHCFGCGAHGDAIGFVMHTQGASFPEAVASLAGEAGLELPKASPTAAAAERARLDIHGVLGAAQAYYSECLRAPAGAAALAYLRERGLTDATIDRFGLGWAGEGRGSLAADLARADISRQQLLDAGLLRGGEDGAIRGELFFNRVMFPIRDRTGRVISFGGRILGVGQPKYVNGPETAVFSKRRNLYGLDFAREAVRRRQTVVAVEGYMDVIALHQAGFEAAVAPLGTALTDEQLEELWRLSPVPVLCFDGDAAGARAAARVAVAALPLIAPERTILLATLPAKQDPDTLVRFGGASAFQAVIDAARPLDHALFEILRESGGDRTVHERATFKQRLEAAARSIKDRNLAWEYRRAFNARWNDQYDKRRGKNGQFLGRQRPIPARPALLPQTAEVERGLILAGILLHHPDLARDVEEAYTAAPLPEALQPLRAGLLGYVAGEFNDGQPLDSAGLRRHLLTLGLSVHLALALRATPSCGLPNAQPAQALAGWWHFYGIMHRDELEKAMRAAERFVVEHGADAAAWARLNGLAAALFRLRQGRQTDDETEADSFDDQPL